MKNIFILLIEVILLVVLMGSYLVFLPDFFNFDYLVYIFVIIFLALAVYSFRDRVLVLNGNYVTITFLFLLSFLIVHFQFYLDYIFALRDKLNAYLYLDYNVVPKAITLAAIALLCYLIGVTYQSVVALKGYQIKAKKNINFSLIFLKILFVSLFILNLYVTPFEYYQGNYGDYMNNNKISYLQSISNQLFQVSIWSYIICIIIGLAQKEVKFYNLYQYILKFGFLFLLIVTLYSFLTLSAGSRNPIIKICLLLFVGYVILSKKLINPIVYLVLIVIFGYFIEFIGYFRNVDGSLDILSRLNEAYLLKSDYQNAIDQKSLFLPSVELAGSVDAYHAIVMDQEHNSKLYGLGILAPLISIVPGLGYLIQSVFSIELKGSAQYITEMMGTSYGTGTTALADIYLNFGLWGVIFIFFVFGYYVAKLDEKSYRDFKNISLLNQVLFMVLISNAIYLGRASIFYVFSDVVLVYVIVIMSILFQRKV
ncbi:MAG: O-antigen polymerase [Acinetobacter sp.]|uniref:O-antigen polymerase n=1 Tax=Acinetobacter sp. TaxID=472 RepID=UPI0026E00F4D|nr:O-antigen polymerase [Acinetobacter sp.]MDO5542827.1 O-antigen polymerase [Acinetobacter sp.]